MGAPLEKVYHFGFSFSVKQVLDVELIGDIDPRRAQWDFRMRGFFTRVSHGIPITLAQHDVVLGRPRYQALIP